MGLIGPNGSGKTTVLNLFTGEFAGRRAARSGSRQRELLGVAIVPGMPRAHRTDVPARACPARHDRARERHARAGCSARSDLARERPCARRTRCSSASGSRGARSSFGAQLTYIDQKRVELARALATRPQLLLLDEWLAGLNPTELRIGIELIRQIRREGITIVMIEHVMEAIRALCDRVVVMSAGERIAEGRRTRCLSDPQVSTPILETTMLRLERISVCYGKHEALHDVTLEIARRSDDRHPGGQRRRQDHAAQDRRRPGAAAAGRPDRARGPADRKRAAAPDRRGGNHARSRRPPPVRRPDRPREPPPRRLRRSAPARTRRRSSSNSSRCSRGSRSAAISSRGP